MAVFVPTDPLGLPQIRSGTFRSHTKFSCRIWGHLQCASRRCRRRRGLG